MITSTEVQTVLRSRDRTAFFIVDLALKINTVNGSNTRGSTTGTEGAGNVT